MNCLFCTLQVSNFIELSLRIVSPAAQAWALESKQPMGKSRHISGLNIDFKYLSQK